VVGPDLTDGIWDNGGTPAEIHQTISEGLLDRGMPPWNEVLGPKKITAVVAYIMSKHRKSGPVVAEPGALRAAWSAGMDEVPLLSGDQPPLVANASLQLPAGYVMESLCVAFAGRELLLYDLEVGQFQSVWTDARLLRNRIRIRSYTLEGNEAVHGFAADDPLTLLSNGRREHPASIQCLGYDRLADGVRIRTVMSFSGRSLEGEETLRLVRSGTVRQLVRTIAWQEVPDDAVLEFRSGIPANPGAAAPQLKAEIGRAEGAIEKGIWTIRLVPERKSRAVRATMVHPLSSIRDEAVAVAKPADAPRNEDPLDRGSLIRPGYRAIKYSLPRLSSGEDRVMPYALATDPKTGRLYVASGKLGEVFVLSDPTDDGRAARMENFGAGLFADSFGMLHDGESLLVMHRRNITRLRDTDGDGQADRFDRVAVLPQSPDPNAYDFAYGLVRDKEGSLIVSFAPYGSLDIPGSGGVARLIPRGGVLALDEVSYGIRNGVGWSAGPEGELFFTDNQGEWVASSRLSHLVPGTFYGFPHPQQPQHKDKPKGPATIWIPYSWGKSINGVIYDSTGGKFGPFDC